MYETAKALYTYCRLVWYVIYSRRVCCSMRSVLHVGRWEAGGIDISHTYINTAGNVDMSPFLLVGGDL
jgi:hypothetical protein